MYYPMAPSRQVDTLPDDEVRRPSLYEVLLHNDEITTMDFVVTVLIEVFHKSTEEATALMLAVHTNGVGVAGVYPLELAETKVEAVREKCLEEDFPLRCTLREVKA